MDFEKKSFEFQCPECNFYNTALLKQVINRDRVICRGCKKNIILEDKNNECKKAQKVFDDFNNMIKKLF